MSTPGFTPGPWSVPHFARDDHNCNCGYILSDAQQGMGAIATVHVSEAGADWRDGDHEHPAIANANAHLIAAAPDLYEALDKCRAIIKFHVKNAGVSCSFAPDSEPFSALDAYGLAVEALAKASGK